MYVMGSKEQSRPKYVSIKMGKKCGLQCKPFYCRATADRERKRVNCGQQIGWRRGADIFSGSSCHQKQLFPGGGDRGNTRTSPFANQPDRGEVAGEGFFVPNELQLLISHRHDRHRPASPIGQSVLVMLTLCLGWDNTHFPMSNTLLIR